MHGNTDFASTRFRSGAGHGARADAGADGLETSCLRPLQQGLEGEARDAQSQVPGGRESLGDALSAHFGGPGARHARSRHEPLGSLPLEFACPSSRMPLSGRGHLVR